MKSSVFPWSIPVVPVYWNGPFEIRTIQNLNTKMFGIGMAFGISSSDFVPPLYMFILVLLLYNIVIFSSGLEVQIIQPNGAVFGHESNSRLTGHNCLDFKPLLKHQSLNAQLNH